MTKPHLPIQVLERGDLDADEARALTDSIRSKLGDLQFDIAKAWMGRAHTALGYAGWDDYVKAEFGKGIHLPREERKAVTAVLRGVGMSTRAIASATGVSHPTIINDLSGGQDLPPDFEAVPVTGLDGKTYTVTCTPPQTPAAAQPAPPQETITCPTCGGTGKVTQ